jgi:glutathione synthase/RimK-type ligase-like ATP-grasp enzyme
MWITQQVVLSTRFTTFKEDNMKKILALIDYKGNFGSKWNSIPYRSGMNLSLLKKYFEKLNYDFETKIFSEFNFKKDLSKPTIILYTSSEDDNYKYKDYIEDIILGAQEMGVKVVPSYKFLRANNNKVFMEILRDILISDINLKSNYLCAPDDKKLDEVNYPIVMKESKGAMGSGVSLIKNKKQLIQQIAKINRIKNLINIKNNIKDFLRPYKHKGYIKESLYREKFILQEFIPNLKSDYKILIFGKRYYIFERPVRQNDFRASGSGNKNYKYGSSVKINLKLFTYAEQIYQILKVPNLSLDICTNGQKFSLFEFQAIYFGTVGQYKSDGYYINKDSEWIFISEKLDLEKVYVDSIDYYLKHYDIF